MHGESIMKIPHPKSHIALLLTMTFVVAPAAVAAELPLKGPIPFKTFDSDDNKVISPEEFVSVHNQRRRMQFDAGMRPRHGPGFTYFDLNGDNQITEDELQQGRKQWRAERGNMPGQGGGMGRGMGQGMGPGQGMGRGMGMNRGRNMPSFEDFDLNGDGVLKKTEFYDARAKRMFQRAEQGYPMRNAASAPPFEMIDTNRDGSVTKEEFAAHQAEHQRMRGGQ